MSWRCFFIEPTGTRVIELRRFTYGHDRPCPVSEHGNGCDASSVIAGMSEDELEPYTLEGRYDDPRWPSECDACGREFRDEDRWQVNARALYAPASGQELPEGVTPTSCWTLRDPDLPVGAMWDADWLAELWKGPDGRSLVVRCPGNWDWHVDGPASNGPGWERTGEVPRITAQPSIGAGEKDGRWYYHGWLRDGVLSDPLPDSAMLRETS